ncbi:MAG: alanine--tRNA ligase [Bacilli bacterium]|nr:alanine--tRNA ligase [Bacilli bacterium]
MRKLSSQEIRETWLNFFKERGHVIDKGASLIPLNDPTLLWINAGVSALKKYFDGSEIPLSKRITNVQRCIRTNDIDNVGKTARHHTFFEMLGNFSIGDYFRKEVIEWAFTILTSEKYFGIDKDKLYITYHPTDLETFELWQKQGMKADHLIPLEGNYWEIGEGPCGPNTEVFFDRGEKYDPENIGIRLLKEDIENDRYIEIWGIVFSQFNAQAGVARENYKELPHKNIDTGAGLERIACVLQETETNFETDLFMPIIKEIEKLSGVPYKEPYMPFRVIADHIRTCTFALSDGATFSNEGRGYVLRRLLRRAMRYGQKINLNEPFLYKLVHVVVENMKGFYPYLIEKEELVKKLVKIEEEKFIKTLTSGENLLNNLIEKHGNLTGEEAFKLYDTFGFPIELTVEICEDRGIKVDLDKFNECLNHQKEMARAARKNEESFNKQSKDLLEFNVNSEYLYDNEEVIKAKVVGLFKNGVKVESIDDEGDVIFDKTNFYAEMGGEVADTGEVSNEEFFADVTNVIHAPNKQNLHHIKVKMGELKVNDEVSLKLDLIRHHNIMKNHSATHLLQSALKEVLGDDVHQKGSFVCENYLRFDFSYFEKVSKNDLLKIETIVNEYINKGIERVTQVLSLEEANKTNAIHEFGEKYGETVRVVNFGKESIEFCGGCHVYNTKEIGLFVIESEESISSGVRRIQALTGIKAYEYLKARAIMLDNTKDQLGTPTINDIENKINQLDAKINELEAKIKEFNEKACSSAVKSLKNEYVEKENFKVLIKYLPEFNKANLMNICDGLKANNSKFVVVLVGKDGEKFPLMVALDKELGLKAGDIVKKITSICGGNGGGRPDLAQGSILDVEKFSKLTWEDIK